MTNTPKQKGLRGRLLLLAGGTFLGLLIAEFVCRVALPEKPPMRFQQDVDELQSMRLHAATRMIESDPELFWRLTPDTRLTRDSWPFFGRIANSQSLREEAEIPRQKPAGERRILFVGDSCTFGYGVSWDEAFPQVVEAQLPGTQCINAGVPGYSLFQGWRYLETRGLNLQPDMVVLNFGWNDYSTWDNRSDADHHAHALRARPPGVLAASRFCRLAWRVLRTPQADEGPDRPRVLPGEFRELLAKVKALTDARGIELLVLVWPMRGNTESDTPAEFRMELQQEMLATGQALDLVPLARGLVTEHGTNAIYLDNGHVSALAHAEFAKAIAARIGAAP